MPVHPSLRCVRPVVLALAAVLLAACATSAADPTPAASPPPAIDPASGATPEDEVDIADPEARDVEDGSYEIALIADLGPLPDGSGNAVVETTWTVDAAGTRSLVVDTPAGYAARHVMTDDEHWWWLEPAARESIADAEWIRFDLGQIEAVGAELPEIVAEARVAVPDPGEVRVGQVVAGHEVLAVDQIGPDEVHLTVAGIERPLVHRRRALPAGTTIELPDGAVDVADLPDVLRW